MQLDTRKAIAMTRDPNRGKHIMTEFEQAIHARGYYHDPNVAHRWYAGSPGVPRLPLEYEVHVYHNTYAVHNWMHDHTRGMPLPVFHCESIQDLWTYIATHGGMPESPHAGGNVWN